MQCSVLDIIIWPSKEETDNDDDDFPVPVKCRIAGYLWQFLETVTEDKLKQLVKFWVGWELPMKDMQVEVVQAAHPSSSTCCHILRLPGHYTSNEFSDHLEGCIACNDTSECTCCSASSFANGLRRSSISTAFTLSPRYPL
ncbi:hypothetical protein MHYP_G00161560 [Metynnis hypsauchen]